MINLVLHGDGLVWVVLLLVFLAFGIPIILLIIGLVIKE